MTIDPGSPVSFLNWTTAKTLMVGAPKIKFIPAEELNLSTQFVDYNKQPIQILGALYTSIRSAGGVGSDRRIVISDRTPSTMYSGIRFTRKLGIQTSQKSAPSQNSRFDVLLCEQSDGMKHQFYQKFPSLSDRKGASKITR